MNHTGTVNIKTERLLLRRFARGDAAAAYENFGSDPLVGRYISFIPCATMQSAERFIAMHLQKYGSDPDFYGWAIDLNGTVIGSAGLFNIDDGADSCELGYSIGSRWWGKGYATEAATAIVKFAFDQMGAHRVFASHHAGNTASGRVLQKIGMQFEGTMRDGQRNPDGSYSDLKLYAILATQRYL